MGKKRKYAMWQTRALFLTIVLSLNFGFVEIGSLLCLMLIIYIAVGSHTTLTNILKCCCDHPSEEYLHIYRSYLVTKIRITLRAYEFDFKVFIDFRCVDNTS